MLRAGAASLGAAALVGVPHHGFGQAPAVIKGTRLAILQPTYLVAAAQDLFKRQAEDWGKMSGVTMVVDFLNWPDLQGKVSAAVHAGGVDIVDLWRTWNFLYRDNLVDLTEEAEEVGRRGGGLETRTMVILKNSKNIPAAKEFLKWWFQYSAWWRLQEGYYLQHVKKLADDPIWFKDPKMTAFREEPKYRLNMGYAGPPGEKASLALSKYNVVDTFAKAVQSGDAAGAIKWGVEQIRYSGFMGDVCRCHRRAAPP